MAEAYPPELRRRVVEAYESGDESYPEVALRFAVGEASVKRWVLQFARTGTIEAQRKAGGRFSTIDEVSVDALVKKLGDPTAGELTVAFNGTRRRKARVHVSSMKRALHRFGYVVKKSADGRWRVCGRTS